MVMIRIRIEKFDSGSNSYSRNYFSTQFSSTFRNFFLHNFPVHSEFFSAEIFSTGKFFSQKFSVHSEFFFAEILCPGERSELLGERWISNKKCCTVLYSAARVSRVWVINRI